MLDEEFTDFSASFDGVQDLSSMYELSGPIEEDQIELYGGPVDNVDDWASS